MSESVESRLDALEREVQRLSEELVSLPAEASRRKDWRRAFGWAVDDPGYEEIARLGRAYRDRDRAVGESESPDAGSGH